MAAVNLQEGRTSSQTAELELATETVLGLTEGFSDELRLELFCELLKRLAQEKEQRRARNLNHWTEYAKDRVPGIAEELLAERGERITVHLKAGLARWNELAWRVTRDPILTDIAVGQTAWELWHGKTREDAASHALVMNARNLLEKRRNRTRTTASLDGLVSAAAIRGEEIDFPSHRSDDRDPLEILIARDEQRETDDELTYAIDNVHCQGNKGIRRSDWWKESALSELERQVRRTKNGGSPE